jgi:hypothetical protein
MTSCEHCGQPITRRGLMGRPIWIHAATHLMSCGPFYTSRARPARD